MQISQKFQFQFRLAQKLATLQYTVWKCHDFSVTQILREINYGDSGSSKPAVLAILVALKKSNLVNFTLQKMQKFIKITIQSLSMC